MEWQIRRKKLLGMLYFRYPLVTVFTSDDLDRLLSGSPHAIIGADCCFPLSSSFPSRAVPHSIMFLLRRKPPVVPDAVRLEIFLYHFVSDRRNDFTLHGHTVTPDVFRSHLEYLAARYTIVRLSEAVGLPPGRKGPFAAVCFDDGYRCILEEAYPVLQAMRIPATMFVNPPVLGNRDLLWRDKIRYLIRRELEEEFIAFLRSRRGRYRFGRLPALGFYKWTKNPKALGDMAIQKDVDAFFAEKGFDPAAIAYENGLFMEESDVAPREFLAFGNHTWSHPILTLLPKDRQEEEIGKCHAYLAARGVEATGLALPFSPFNRHTVAVCRRLGYPFLLTVYEHSNRLEGENTKIPVILHRRMAPRNAEDIVRLV
jgi:peptidoglycan/xylan/chitin deacetylase (PgdA/CDA1 family)